MKRSLSVIAGLAGILFSFTAAAAGRWTQVSAADAPKNVQLMNPVHYLVYKFDAAATKVQLLALSADPSEGMILSLPMPDGRFRDFRVWQSSMMPDDLAARFPEIRTFTAEAVNDATVTAKLDLTVYGFHAMIFDGDRTSFIDPYDNYNDGYYMVHYKKDETRLYTELMKCQTTGLAENSPTQENAIVLADRTAKTAAKSVNGYKLRTYRLALSADHYYCEKATGSTTPTVAQALSKMTTTMNRVNGIYERELSVHMTFVSAETSIIFTTAAGDPFDAINTDASACLDENQTVCDGTILSANYDIGHVFTTGGGGLSSRGVVCRTNRKAQSVTGSSSPTGDGFDVDFVAHEMGHQFSGQHPFNNGTDGSCGGGNRVQSTSYEPGSGSTIMAYAGICSPDNIQPHSDAYFHSVNLVQMLAYINGTTGDGCAVKTVTDNKPSAYSAFAASYAIPYLTPFELTGPALIDSVVDSAVLYTWEEWDLGVNDGTLNEGTDFSATHAVGPLFRSYPPVTSATRIFPKLSMVLAGTLSNAGVNNAEGEKVPDVARSMNFACTFRNIRNNYGYITIPDDRISLNAINTGAGFKVTSQSTTGVSYTGGGTETITWDVVSTTAAPINATNVDIYMSADGGTTWGYKVGTFPNSGTASITVPNPFVTTTTARFKVKGSGNVFFNVNGKNFTVTYDPAVAISTGVSQAIAVVNDTRVFPVPVSDLLHITSSVAQSVIIYNTVGQKVWTGQMQQQLDIPVATWAKGNYIMRVTDTNDRSAIKRFVVE